ncbi:hypothetical protein DXG03_004386, partial [Asterophora parasitica]
ITSYINNLHPAKHRDFYTVIEQLVSHTIPLWNLTLTPLKAPRVAFNRVPYDEAIYDPDPQNWPESRWPAQEKNEDRHDYGDRLEQWFIDTRKPVLPNGGTFDSSVPFPLPVDLQSCHIESTKILKPENSVDLVRDYRDRGLQVIIKLANIELTYEKPIYGGGTWHVEGMMNEQICAPAIYYYDIKNITTSGLPFRQKSDTEEGIDHPQFQYDWLTAVFGCEDKGPMVQDVGNHRVQPITLADPTKPGHRKIVALFLDDPNIRIISTANVPCQHASGGQKHPERRR